MKKEKTPFHGIKLFTGMSLCFILTSCNGQVNNGDKQNVIKETIQSCLLYTSDAADERSSVDLGGRRIIKKKKKKKKERPHIRKNSSTK